MSIKSDKWIRMMANEYRMIEPYEPGQVRHAVLALLEHLEYSGEEQEFGGKDEHVDNFVCSFLAEPYGSTGCAGCGRRRPQRG